MTEDLELRTVISTEVLEGPKGVSSSQTGPFQVGVRLE